MGEGWNREDVTVAMALDETAPAHTAQELSVVQDVLGTYTTSFGGSSYNRIENIKMGLQRLMKRFFIPAMSFHLHRLLLLSLRIMDIIWRGRMLPGKTLTAWEAAYARYLPRCIIQCCVRS